MRRLAAGLLLVTVGWLASPSAVPVYDGVGQPDQPYRYVGREGSPPAVTVTVKAQGGVSGPINLQSAESGPQVLLDLAAGAFRTTGAVVRLTSTPVAGDGQQAPQGTVDGNVYRFTVSSGAALQPDVAQGFLFLRAAEMTRPDPVVVHRDGPGGAWEKVRTTRTGRDVLSAPFRALGDYAVVDLPGSKPLSASGSGLSTTRLLLLGGGVLLMVVVAVLVLRRSGGDEDAEVS
jgi:hypothetical protein